MTAWWRNAVIYQIYPRSFYDANGDGIGDLPGILARLDYLQLLGVNAIWLNPVYPSPMRDFGYDVSDYCNIDPVFGDMNDMQNLIAEVHRRGMRIIMDMVFNHTSHQHPWFKASIEGDAKFADFYIWAKHTDHKKRLPNNWRSAFGGTAWRWHHKKQAYYLHSFLPAQPDLNWRNPAVEKAVFDILDFWLAQGIDGFRFDVINLLYKDVNQQNNPLRFGGIGRPYEWQQHRHDRNQPETHLFLKRLRRHVDNAGDILCIGEIMYDKYETSATAASFCGAQDELHLTFNFELLHARFSANALHMALTRWYQALGDNWPSITFSNHDFKRQISRLGCRDQLAKAKLLAMLALTVKGTPVLYYGEEIGMAEEPVRKREIQDPAGQFYWPIYKGRDGCRRPMCWDDSEYAGFSAQRSWLPISPAYAHKNVLAEQLNANSLWHAYRQLLQLRRDEPCLQLGDITLLPVKNQVLCFERTYQGTLLRILLNLSNRPQNLPWRPSAGDVCIFNNQKHLHNTSPGRLNPWQGLIFRGQFTMAQSVL
jgi:alpha-glucosidase